MSYICIYIYRYHATVRELIYVCLPKSVNTNASLFQDSLRLRMLKSNLIYTIKQNQMHSIIDDFLIASIFFIISVLK